MKKLILILTLITSSALGGWFILEHRAINKKDEIIEMTQEKEELDKQILLKLKEINQKLK